MQGDPEDTSRAKGRGLIEQCTDLGSVVARNVEHTTTELLEAMVAASLKMSHAYRSAENKFDRYKYSTLEDYLNVIRVPALEEGLLVVCDAVGEPEYSTRPTRKGEAMTVARVVVNVTVIHAKSKGWIAVQVRGEGEDRSDKAVYKAITGGRKYALAMLFGIYTTDDPECSRQVDPTTSEPIAPKAPLTGPWGAMDQSKAMQQLASTGGDDLVRMVERMAGGQRLKGAPKMASELAAAAIARADRLAEEKTINGEQLAAIRTIAALMMGTRRASELSDQATEEDFRRMDKAIRSIDASGPNPPLARLRGASYEVAKSRWSDIQKASLAAAIDALASQLHREGHLDDASHEELCRHMTELGLPATKPEVGET